VSHNAAYRHFANQEDLLAAVADRCLNKLGMLMIERADRVRFRDPARRAKARLNAIGRAYIEFARTEPGWFRAAFTSARPHDAPVRPGQTPLSDGSMPAPTNPFAVLNARLDELVVAGALRPQRRQGAEFAAWSGVHGLSSLLLDGPLRELPEPAVEQAIDVVLAAIERGLR
jgi:AcrR family transcriptional regulator